MLKLFCGIKSMLEGEKGQALVEYAFILILVAIVVIVMLTGIGGSLNNSYSAVNSSVSTAGTGSGS